MEYCSFSSIDLDRLAETILMSLLIWMVLLQSYLRCSSGLCREGYLKEFSKYGQTTPLLI